MSSSDRQWFVDRVLKQKKDEADEIEKASKDAKAQMKG